MKSPTPAHPMPATGGSYIRNADGSLTPVEQPSPLPAGVTVLQEPEPAPAAATAAPAAKSVKKET